MGVLPQIKVTDINLDTVTEKALITTIDVFRFTHEENSHYVRVDYLGADEYDFLDEIEISEHDICAKDLERIAINWIFRHVELVDGD